MRAEGGRVVEVVGVGREGREGMRGQMVSCGVVDLVFSF